jgi:hypothetical protein
MRAKSTTQLQFQPGTRVRLIGTPSGVTLTANVGEVVGPDPDWGGYFIVRLDQPAVYYCSGHDEPLDEVTVAGDNLRVLPHAGD